MYSYLLFTISREWNYNEEEEMVLHNGDLGNVIYILLLPLANVLLSIIIVLFIWNKISERGTIDHAETCHNRKVGKDEVQILLTQCLPDSYHAINAKPMEASSFFQFLGGGDFYITKDLSSLVVVTPVNNNSPQTASAPKESMELPNVSPTSSSDSKLISPSVEAKNNVLTSRSYNISYQPMLFL